VVSDVLKECIALIFKGKAVKNNVIACKTCSANETTVFYLVFHWVTLLYDGFLSG
jgi:hypothetical protein